MFNISCNMILIDTLCPWRFLENVRYVESEKEMLQERNSSEFYKLQLHDFKRK